MVVFFHLQPEIHRHLREADGGNGVAYRLRQPCPDLTDAEAAAFAVVDLNVDLRTVPTFYGEVNQLGVDPQLRGFLVLPDSEGEGDE